MIENRVLPVLARGFAFGGGIGPERPGTRVLGLPLEGVALEFGMDRVEETDGIGDRQADIVAALAEGAEEFIGLVAAQPRLRQPAENNDLPLVRP